MTGKRSNADKARFEWMTRSTIALDNLRARLAGATPEQRAFLEGEIARQEAVLDEHTQGFVQQGGKRTRRPGRATDGQPTSTKGESHHGG